MQSFNENDKTIFIEEKDREKATSVPDFKDYILKALDNLDGEGTRDEIYKKVTEKHQFNDYGNMYNQLKSTGAKHHKVGNNRFAFGLKELQRENKIKKIIDKKKVKFYYKL